MIRHSAPQIDRIVHHADAIPSQACRLCFVHPERALRQVAQRFGDGLHLVVAPEITGVEAHAAEHE
jgi:hypothetical protein